MYEIRFSESYEKRAVKFFKKHKDLFDRYKKTIEVLEIDPYHPSLRLHRMQGKLRPYSSVSITMKYRIVIDFIIVDKVIVLIDIGSHDDVYQ